MKRFDIDGLIEFLGFKTIKEFCEHCNIHPNTVTNLRKQKTDGKMYLGTILKIQEACPKKDLTPFMPVYAQIIKNSDWKYKRKKPKKK